MHDEKPITIRGLVLLLLTEALVFGAQQVTGMFSGWAFVAVGIGGLLAMNFEKKGEKRRFWWTVVITLAAVIGLTMWHGRKPTTPSPSPVADKAELKALEYRICGGFSIAPDDHKTHNFQLEIDPSNPNDRELTLHIKRWYVQFDGHPGEAVGSDTMRIAPKASIVPGVTREPAIGARVWFKPFKRLSGRVTGTYHYEMSYGADEDTATTPIEINGDIAVDFGPDGLPIGSNPNTVLRFTPTTGRNMNFDPTPCEVDPAARV